MRLSEQDGAAFDRIAREVARPLFRTAYLLAGDWYLAEDLVQETLAKLYRAWPIAADQPLAYARRKKVGPYGPKVEDRALRQKQFAAMMRAGHSVEAVRAVLGASAEDGED